MRIIPISVLGIFLCLMGLLPSELRAHEGVSLHGGISKQDASFYTLESAYLGAQKASLELSPYFHHREANKTVLFQSRGDLWFDILSVASVVGGLAFVTLIWPGPSINLMAHMFIHSIMPPPLEIVSLPQKPPSKWKFWNDSPLSRWTLVGVIVSGVVVYGPALTLTVMMLTTDERGNFRWPPGPLRR